MFGLQFLGICLTAGQAIASSCVGWTIIGVSLLFFVPVRVQILVPENSDHVNLILAFIAPYCIAYRRVLGYEIC